MSVLMRRLLSSAVYAADGGGGGGGDDAAKAAEAAAAAAKAAEEAAKGGDAAAKAAAEKATADKAAIDKQIAEARTAGLEEGKKAGAVSWRDTITDPELKKQAERFSSPGDLLKSNNELRADNSKRVKVPDEKATPEERAQFAKAIGVPEKVEGYEITLPEIDKDTGIAKHKVGDKEITITAEDKALVDLTLPMFLKSGAPKAVVQSVVAGVLELNEQLRDKAIKEIDANRDQQDAALKKMWPGKEYETNRNIVARVTAQQGEDFANLLNTTRVGSGVLGDHPAMMRVLSLIGRMTAEGDIVIAPTEDQRMGAQQELDKLNKDVPIGSPEYKTPAHQAKLRKLYEQTGANAPLVGSQGRTN